MAPSMILLMRHAEKPADANDPDLSQEGSARAEKLATYIPQTIGAIDFLFATTISKHSARPFETIKPLSKATGVPIDAPYADQDYDSLAAELLSDQRYAGRRGVIAWHHRFIPSFAGALGAANSTYPNPWDPKVFNLILKFEWGTATGPVVTKVVEPF